MERLRKELSCLPRGIFTIITLLIILWLTLAPKPLGDEPPPLFPGADKLAHGLMFGFFTAMMSLDLQRKTGWKYERWSTVMLIATISTLTGVAIEFIQASMGLGRSFEYADMIADAAGAYAIGVVWISIQKLWIERES